MAPKTLFIHTCVKNLSSIITRGKGKVQQCLVTVRYIWPAVLKVVVVAFVFSLYRLWGPVRLYTLLLEDFCLQFSSSSVCGLCILRADIGI